MNYYIIVFKNTHDAMSAEKKLNEAKYNFRIMPTPTTITMSCGICARIDNEEDIKSIEEEKLFTYKNIYLRQDGKYIEFK